MKLMTYFREKYPRLLSVKYFEGVEDGDAEKITELEQLQHAGYEIYTLARKTYADPAIFRRFSCEKCYHKQEIMVLKSQKKLKSNIDVFLATECLSD